jgi:hypothetical protein
LVGAADEKRARWLLRPVEGLAVGRDVALDRADLAEAVGPASHAGVFLKNGLATSGIEP